MKAIKIIYWTTTGIFSVVMILSAFMYLTSPQMEEGFSHLGFTHASFRVELAILKIVGVAVLLFPTFKRLKEWAYSGFFITLLSAFIAHTTSGDGPDKFMGPVIFGFILLGSYWSLHKKEKMI